MESRRRRTSGILRRRLLGLAVMAGLALVPAPALADPTVGTATAFNPVDAGRSHMDVGGAWNGSTDVSLAGNGDGFSASLTNADDDPDEAALDLTLQISLPAGFSYQTGTPLSASLSGSGCGADPTVQVTDNSGPPASAGTLDVDFDGAVEAYDLPDDCAITVDLELLASTDDAVGGNSIGFDWNYSNGGPASDTQAVQVRDGAAALAVNPLSQTSTGPGDPVSWSITVSNEGDGGLYAVEIDETDLSASSSFGFNAPLTLVSAPRAVSIPNPPGDLATIAYLAPGESFTVSAAADVLSCVDLDNDVRARHKVLLTDLSVAAEVVLDLQNPALAYTPFSGNLDYDDPVTFPIPVSNNGSGTAVDVTLQTTLENGGPAVTVVSTGPAGEWVYDGGGLFRYVGDQGAGAGNLPAGATTTLEIELEPADVCTDTGGGTVQYEPRYENVCGTVFSSPTDTGSLGGAQPLPGLGVAKSSSVAQLGIGSGDPASYTIDLAANDTDLITDGTFTVTDTLPPALGGPLTVTASGGSFSCPGGTCDPGEQLTWDVANPGIGGVTETLTIDFQAPPDSQACLGGTTLTNTADVQPATTTELCTVGGTGASADIDLSNVPTPIVADAFHFNIGAGPFETGLPGDGDCATANTGEGECIPHMATYEFEAGYPGIWDDTADGVQSRFTDDFGGVAAQQVVAGSVEVNALQNGSSVSGGFQPVPAAAIVDGSGQLVLDLGFLAGAGFFGDNNVSHPSEDRELRIQYSTTVSDAALGAGGSLTVSSFAELIIRDGQGGSGACENTLPDPADTIYTTPGDDFEVARAQVAVSVQTQSGQNTADICEVLPLDIDIDNATPPGFQASDILAQLAVGGSDYQHVDPPTPTYSGQFQSLDSGGDLDYQPGAAGGPTWSFVDRVLELTGGGIATSVQLLPGATTGFGNGTPVTVTVDYDDNETTLSPPVGGSATPGRAFSTGAGGNFTPVQVRQGDLSIQATPQQRFVTGDQVSWTIFVTNSGDGGAYNVQIQNDLADALALNLADTAAATPSCGGVNWTLTNPSGDLMQWTIDEVPALTTCEINVVADVPPTTNCSIPNDGPQSNRIAGEWGCAGTAVQQGDLDGPFTNPLADDSPDFVFAEPSLRLTHEASFCNLCDPVDTSGGGPFDPNDGTVRLLVRNNGNSRIQNVEVIETLPTGVGIDLVPGTVEFSTDGGSTWQAGGDPTPLGGGQYEFTPTEIPTLAELVTPSEEDVPAGAFAEVLIRYNIASDESSLPGPHPIVVEGRGERPCDGQVFPFGPRQDSIEVRAPDITVSKTGDNLDRANDGTPEQVVGTPGETIEWTIDITNNGDHNTRRTRLRDVLLDASGVPVANRTTASPGLDDSLVLFGPGLPPGGLTIADADEEDYVAIPTIAPGATATYRLQETLGGNCFNADNQADLTWGCAINPSGQASNLDSPSDNDDTARLLMVPDFSADDAVLQAFAELPGGRTEITLTLRNDGAPANSLVVRDDLPDDLRIDTTFTPVVSGGGMSFDSIDTGSGSTNGDPGTPNHPRILLNGTLDFGETTTVTFVAIQAAAFDTSDDPFENPETIADGSDPTPPATGDNRVNLEFADTVNCDFVSPPPSEDIETLDPQTPDVDLTVTPVRRVVADGESATFTFTLENVGDLFSIAEPVEFRLDTVDGGWSNVSVSVTNPGPGGAGGACQATTPYTCSASQIGTLRRADTATIEVTATANDRALALPILQRSLRLIGTAEGDVVEADGTDTGDDFSFDRARPAVIGFELSKTLSASSEPYTADPELAVGEEGEFALRAHWFGFNTNLGEAVRAITVRDRLDPANGILGYVARSDSTAGGASIGSVNGSPAGVLSPPPVVSGSVDWLLNDITLMGQGTLTVDLTTRLLNLAAAIKGTTASNALDAEFTVDYGGGNSFDFESAEFGGTDPELATTADVTVAEPSVGFVKEVRNITDGIGFQDADPGNRLPADGNDIVEYRVTVTNAATGTADAPLFGVIVDDQFVTDEVVLDTTAATSGVDTDGDGNIDISACGAITSGPPDRILFDRDNCTFGSAGTNLDQLDPGEALVFLYRGTVQGSANPAEILDNAADLTAFSLLDPAPQDGSHEGNQSAPLGAPGDTDGAREYDAQEIAGIVIENNTAIEKTACGPANTGTPVCSIASTSPLGDGGDGEPDLRVGDSLRYQIVVDLAPQATIDNFELGDTLPPGFEFTGDVSAFDSQQIDFSLGDPNPPGPAAGDTTHTWSFGTIQVTGDNPQIRFDYEVITVDDPDPGFGGGDEIPAPGASLDQDNAGTLSFDTATSPPPFTQSDFATVDVAQPQLSVAKVSDPTSPATVGESDPVEYTVSVTNTGNAPAYDPVIEDVLAAGMRGTVGVNDAITMVSIDVGGTAKNLVAPTDPGGDFLADGQARWTLPSTPGGGAGDYTIGPGETLVLVYQADVNADIGADQDLSNAATATRWFSFDDDDPPAGTVAADRREYGPSNTDTAPLRSSQPGNLAKQNPPATTGATIGEELTYTLEVPADPAALDVSIYDAVITDELPAETVFVSASFLGGGATGTPQFSYDAGTNTLTIEDPATGIDILPGNSARFEVTVRVANTLTADAGDALVNTARYAFSAVDDDGTAENSGGPDVTTPAITLTEPLITPAKQARNVSAGDAFGGGLTAPDAGDVLEYCLRFPALPGAIRSDAFDLAFSDTLPAGLSFQPGSAQLADAACSPGNPGGDTLQPPAVSGQTLDWTLAAGNDVDVPAGGTVAVLYRATVDDTVAPMTTLTNTATVDWTSLDGADPNERTFDAGNNPPDDYRATTATSLDSADTTQLVKLEVSTPPLGTGGDGDGDYRLGERVTYRVELTDLTEGTLDGLVLTDTLPVGLQFEAGSSTVTQGGGISPDPTTVTPTVVSGDGSAGNPQTIEWDFGDVVNAGEANNATTPDTLTIEYSAIVRDDAPGTENAANDVGLVYLDAAAAPITRTDLVTIDIVVPAFAAPVKSTTAPTPPGTVSAGDTIPYTLELTNTGAAPAYDVLVEDVIPDGMRADADAAGTIAATVTVTDSGGATVFGPQVVNGSFPGTFASDGRVQWDLDTGGADDRVPAGGTLTLAYSVDVDDDLGPGVQLTNSAGALEWYSIDTDAPPAEGTPVQLGPGPTDSVTVQTPNPGPLAKASTTTESTMGDTIVYRLRIPDAAFGAQLFDVEITDTLPSEVEFLAADHAPTSDVSEPLDASVDGSNVLTIVAAGDPDGIDIPAGDVAVIDVTVRHNDAGGGNAGDSFANSASYTWERAENGSDDFSGGAAGSHSIDVIEPDLVFTKTGPATIDRAGGGFTLTAQNIGSASAFDTVVTDVLPPEMRDTQPVIDSVTVDGPGGPRTLANGTDYTTAWTPASGTLEFTFESASAALAPGETLRIDYTAFLDADAPDGASLTNVAGTTRYATQDGSGGSFPPDTRVFTFALSDGTPGTPDHEDAHQTTSEAPILEVDKAVDAGTALPGQTLTYTITVINSGSGEARVDLTDDFGALDTDDVYQPGTLTVTSPPAGFGSDASDPNGGTGGKGLIDFRDVVVPAGGSATVEATIDARPVVSDGDEAVNQGSVADRFFAITEPTDDPATANDDDPTVTVFGAQPDLSVTKRDTDVTGDPNVLAVGDTLEYTIEVRNDGTEDVINAVLTDAVPGNTTYVAGSTTLNGAPVADAGSASNPRSPLEDGLGINTPGSPAGTVAAQGAGPATITFRVTVDPDLVAGAVISNQAVFTGEGSGSGIVPTVPSDDPDTPIVGDPTQSVVGAAPLLDVQKTVSADTDPVQSGPAPPSSVLTYTIVIGNNGTTDATGTVFTDEVPANASYVVGSTTLNGIAVPDAAGGTSPLGSAAGGLPVSSSDRTPPLPGAAAATISAGESATVVFRVTLDDGLADGTVISNQGTLVSDQQPDEPSDADGNDENGDQPTVVIVGGQPILEISKEVFVVGGGTIQPDGLLDYAVRVENTGPVDATNVVITDDLDAPVPGQLGYIPGSGRLDGASGPVGFAAGVVTASAGTLAAGDATELRFRVRVDAGLAPGTTIDNSGRVTADGGIDETGSVAIDVGGAPGTANLNGTVWLDTDLDDAFDDPGERPLPGWRVTLRFNGRTLAAVDSAADGTYALRGLAPGGDYELRFSFPGQSTTFGETAATLGTTGRQLITAIDPAAGANVLGEDMPVTANGTVYDSIARSAAGGARLTLLDSATATAVANGCFDDPTQQGQVTASDGLYLFELNFSDPSCPAPGDYLLEITPPAGGGAPSTVIPPTTDGTTAPYDVAVCPDDAIAPPPAAGRCEAQVQDTPPGSSVPIGPGTRYYLHLAFAGSGNAAQMYNHHLPVDPDVTDAVALSKTTPKVEVVRGELVPYTITATNGLGGPLPDSEIDDTIPPGFKYIEGSARVDGSRIEPDVDGRELTWDGLTLPANEPFVIKLILVVGGGVGEGEYVNRARVRNPTLGGAASGEATATVRVVPDPTFDCTDIIGKVFDDRDADGRQDEGEPGLGGVRLTTARGLLITTDTHGRYHVTCAAVPDRDRGSNFILKLDERTLPSGFRTTTENPRVVRATRGKMVRLNFGATPHRVIRIDLAGPAFVPARTELRPQWQGRLDPVFEQLAEGPSVLRLSYLGDAESEALAERRLASVREWIADEWQARDGGYDLRIETELFWRRGKPRRAP